MNVLLVTSPEPSVGKTTTIVALGQRLRRLGKKVGYRRLPGEQSASDAAFVASALRLSDPREVPAEESIPALVSARKDVDVLFVEADSDRPDDARTIAASTAVSVTPLIVARYRSDGLTEQVLAHARALGLNQAWVVLNAVPEKGRRQVEQRVAPVLREAGFAVLGVVPQDRALLGLSVGELATDLGADIITATDQVNLPVEAVMISAMSDEGAEAYFRRISRKAVVAGGDRPDIHMPALATDTSCIVLTEGHDPDPTVYKTADDQGVPLLKVNPSTIETLEHISTALQRARFRQGYKVPRAVAVFSGSLDEASLFRVLGVDGREVA